MKNTFMEIDTGEELAFNRTDLSNLAMEIGHPPDTISFLDSKDLLVDVGNNFIAEVLDCAKLVNTGGKLTIAHIKKALRLKFGTEVGGPVEDYNTIKMRNMESDKIDEKLTK
jgi:hypothetical protein